MRNMNEGVLVLKGRSAFLSWAVNRTERFYLADLYFWPPFHSVNYRKGSDRQTIMDVEC